MNSLTILPTVGFVVLLGGILLSIVWSITTHMRKMILPYRGNKISMKPAGFNSKTVYTQSGRNLKWPVSMDTEHGRVRAETCGLGMCGAFLRCDSPLSLRDRLSLTIEIPNNRPLRFQAEVIWSNQDVPDEGRVNRVIGIRFVQAIEKDLQSLKNAIAAFSEAPNQVSPPILAHSLSVMKSASLPLIPF